MIISCVLYRDACIMELGVSATIFSMVGQCSSELTETFLLLVSSLEFERRPFA